MPIKRINIGDINSIEDIDNLTVKDMKALLFRSFVDYKGCVEKDELKNKVVMLWKEHKANEEKGILELYWSVLFFTSVFRQETF